MKAGFRPEFYVCSTALNFPKHLAEKTFLLPRPLGSLKKPPHPALDLRYMLFRTLPVAYNCGAQHSYFDWFVLSIMCLFCLALGHPTRTLDQT